MTAQAVDLSRALRDGHVVRAPVAASTRIYQGSIVEVNSSGNLVVATSGANKEYLGIALEPGDNSGGSARAISIDVRVSGAVLLDVATAAPARGASAYVEDSQTVTSTTGSRTRLGQVIDIDINGVWVLMGR